jgi:integrase
MRREAAGVCQKTLAELKPSDFARYRDRRLTSGIKASTLRRELNPLRNIFKVARREWGLPVQSPFQDLDLPPEPHHRERVASREEQKTLYKAAVGCRGFKQRLLWCALILTALTTGMRRGELLKIEWRDIDFEKRTLHVRAEITKRGRSRFLPVSKWLCLHLLVYRSRVSEKAPSAKVFPISGSAHEQAWKRLCKRAGIQDFTFHDLRHTAGTNYDEIGLTKSENEYMLGHAGGGTNSRYVHGQIELIRGKLDAGMERFELPKDDAELERHIFFLTLNSAGITPSDLVAAAEATAGQAQLSEVAQ